MRIGFLFLVLGLGFNVQAAPADQTLSDTVKNLMTIVKVSDESSRIQQMCQLARTSVDLATISLELLGDNFSTLTRDSAGIAKFNALMPSIIVSDFYSIVMDNATGGYSVNPTPLSKGSGRAGYRVTIGSTVLVITVSKTNYKILDVEWNNVSLVETNKFNYQQELQRFWDQDNFHSLPVTDLVNELVASGKLLPCN